MVIGRGAVEVIERRLVLAPVVEDVAEVDACLAMIAVELERTPEGRDRGVVIPDAMLRITHARDSLRGIRHLEGRDVEELARRFDQRLAEECASRLQHQLDVVPVPEFENPAEVLDGGLMLAELQERLAEPRERILVLGIEHQRFLEALPRPRVFLASEARVTDPHVQLHRVRVERESLTEHIERLIILAIVVQLMRALIVLFGTQKWGWHGSTNLHRMRDFLL